MARLFTAQHASKAITRVVNTEAKYYELLAKARAGSHKVNNTLLQTVRAFDRLVAQASKHGQNLNELLAQGYFDATLSEYKAQSKKSTADETIKWIEGQRNALKLLAGLGKDLSEIEAYYDGLYRDMVLPMQAFEQMLATYFGKDTEFKGAKLIQGTFGNDQKAIALREYQKSEYIQRYIAGYRAALRNPKGTDKHSNAIDKMKESERMLKDMGLAIECKSASVNNKVAINTVVSTIALPAPNPAIKQGKKVSA
jgi:hypothetical protein